jgi:hypothetical protein
MRLSEYIRVEAINRSQRAFIEEHGELMIADRALQKLRDMVYGKEKEEKEVLMELNMGDVLRKESKERNAEMITTSV